MVTFLNSFSCVYFFHCDILKINFNPLYIKVSVLIYDNDFPYTACLGSDGRKDPEGDAFLFKGSYTYSLNLSCPLSLAILACGDDYSDRLWDY